MNIMQDFRVGYLYSLAPIHCGGEGDLGNISEIAREVHTNFPYIPGSSLRGSLRNEVEEYKGKEVADRLFGKELADGKMGVHQIWFGDARLLWVPMRTMSVRGQDIFTWVSCPTLLRDCALISRRKFDEFPAHAVGSKAGEYRVADAKIEVKAMTETQKQSIDLNDNWSSSLGNDTKSHWKDHRIILPDNDFQVLMEHSLWTQVRNKIDEKSGSAGIFWTDVCIPRDTIFYYPWGYSIAKSDPVTASDYNVMKEVLTGLIQVGGQANVGRGWVQSWISNDKSPISKTETEV
jgi:CRISPR-associated protein Cmr4